MANWTNVVADTVSTLQEITVSDFLAADNLLSSAVMPDTIIAKVVLPAVANGAAVTVSGPFAVISVSGDDVVFPNEDDVQVVVSGAGNIEGHVFWGGVAQPIKSWANDLIVVGPVTVSGKQPGVRYAWDVWKPI